MIHSLERRQASERPRDDGDPALPDAASRVLAVVFGHLVRSVLYA